MCVFRMEMSSIPVLIGMIAYDPDLITNHNNICIFTAKQGEVVLHRLEVLAGLVFQLTAARWRYPFSKKAGCPILKIRSLIRVRLSGFSLWQTS